MGTGADVRSGFHRPPSSDRRDTGVLLEKGAESYNDRGAVPGRDPRAAQEDSKLLAGAARQAARGDTVTALMVIDRYLAQPGRDPARGLALYLRGTLLAARGQEDSAEVALRRLVTEYPGSEAIGAGLTQLGSLLLRQGRDTAAVRVLEPVPRAFPDSGFAVPARLALARAAESAGIGHKALEAYLGYISAGLSPERQPQLSEALEGAARLLYERGRSEEAWSAIQSLLALKRQDLFSAGLPVQLLAVGSLTGLGQPELGAATGRGNPPRAGNGSRQDPRLLFLMGHAQLALDRLDQAESLFAAVAADERGGGVPPDSLQRLLMDLSLARERSEEFFAHARRALEEERDPGRALELLQRAGNGGVRLGSPQPVAALAEDFLRRFGAGTEAPAARLIQARALSAAGEPQRALRLLTSIAAEDADSALIARVAQQRIAIYLDAGDTLRAKADLIDYLRRGDDPLSDKDSLLWIYTGIEQALGELPREQELLAGLIADYPASRWWEDAGRRLEELRLFELTQPRRAAEELLDLYRQRRGEVPPLRLAELAAELLADYRRAAEILEEAAPQEPEARLKLIRYRYLAGLQQEREQRGGQGRELVFRAWNEVRSLLRDQGQFTGREQAVELLLNIYRHLEAEGGVVEAAQAEELLRRELAGMGQGPVKAAALTWLGGRCQARAMADSGFAAYLLADSARALWTQAVDAGGEAAVTGRALLELASSVEGAQFAGAQDSAGAIYSRLVRQHEGTRWASLAGLRLGVIYLRQERHSLAYQTIDSWVGKNAYAADNPEVIAALAEGSFLTERYARTLELLSALDLDGLDRERREVFESYLIRAHARLGDYGPASRLLQEFRRRYQDQDSRDHAAAMAVELYCASGSPALAETWLQSIGERSEAYPVARLFALQARLAAGGGNPDKLRGEFEAFRKAPWNAFFRLDPAFLAYRGIMACYMRQDKPDKVQDARDSFRREYPERRAALSRLVLDEIEYHLEGGRLEQAATLYDDLTLLFGDVSAQDRVLWMGYRLDQMRGRAAEAGQKLEQLSRDFRWSGYGQRAKISLAGLLLEMGQGDRAGRLLAELPTETEPDFEAAGLRARLLGLSGDWDQALARRKRQWALARAGEPVGEALLGWAEAAARDGRIEEAQAVLTSLWSPDQVVVARARLALGLLYQESGRPQEALATLEAVSGMFEGRAREVALQALFRKGMILEALGRGPEAVEAYRQLESRAGERSDWARSARDRLRGLGQGGAAPAEARP